MPSPNNLLAPHGSPEMTSALNGGACVVLDIESHSGAVTRHVIKSAYEFDEHLSKLRGNVRAANICFQEIDTFTYMDASRSWVSEAVKTCEVYSLNIETMELVERNLLTEFPEGFAENRLLEELLLNHNRKGCTHCGHTGSIIVGRAVRRANPHATRDEMESSDDALHLGHVLKEWRQSHRMRPPFLHCKSVTRGASGEFDAWEYFFPEPIRNRHKELNSGRKAQPPRVAKTLVYEHFQKMLDGMARKTPAHRWITVRLKDGNGFRFLDCACMTFQLRPDGKGELVPKAGTELVEYVTETLMQFASISIKDTDVADIHIGDVDVFPQPDEPQWVMDSGEVLARFGE